MDLGRRSWFMILFSLAYLGIAYSTYEGLLTRQPLFLHEMLPGPLRTIIWLVGAITAFVAAFLRNVPKAEIWGFVGLCIPVSVRVVSYMVGIIYGFFDIPDSKILFTTGISGFVTFGTILAAIMIVASWPEPHAEYIERISRIRSREDG